MELINGKTAFFATVIYLIVAATIFFNMEKGKKTLSIIGTYWGGILSPIPLIWLTLGYFSQQEDTKLYKEFIENQTIINNKNIDFIKRQNEINEQRSKPNFKFLGASIEDPHTFDSHLHLEFLNSGASVSGVQIDGRHNEIKTLNSWNRSEKKTIIIKDEGYISSSRDKKIERKVTFTNIYGFEKEFILTFNRKSNVIEGTESKIGIVLDPDDTASILPINE
tara:strand:+ start:9153 stop:9818 length:666 start_codon:yes stop_codon:yes gene_type:complete